MHTTLKTIWVYENIQEDVKFYSKLNVALLLASVTLWKKNHPTFECVLYCDSMTKNLLEELQVTHLWDSIILYKHELNIDRSVFWACNKVKVLTEQIEPCILMDHDSLVFKPIHEHLQDKVLVANLEQGAGYYPSNLDTYVRQLDYKPRWTTDSLNVSFLYFPDPKFLNLYSTTSLQMMEDFTKMGTPNSQYLIFAEQLWLRHLLDREQIEYKSLLSDYWDCNAWDWGEKHNKGIWNLPEGNLYFHHYGPLKTYILGLDEWYEREMKMLFNCINIKDLDLSNVYNK